MLADRRALSLIDNFAEQWLRLRGLSALEPDRRAYPTFDDTLATAFEQETRLFLGSVMRENRSILDVLDADYTFLNQRLAENYGTAGVTGPGFRRVSLAGNPERGVPALDESAVEGRKLTTREKVERHRATTASIRLDSRSRISTSSGAGGVRTRTARSTRRARCQMEKGSTDSKD